MADALTTCKSLPTVFFYDLSFLCSIIVSHPLYFSYLIFFSPYLFRFIFFISPLFLTTSLLLILSLIASTFPHSKLGFLPTIVDKLRSKLNDVDQDEEFFRDLEDFEIYRIVFHDPPLLLTVGDPEDKHTVTESEEQRRLERLFEELDRFEASTASFEMKEIETRSHIEESVTELQKLAPLSDEDQKTDENSFSVNSSSWRSESSSSFGSCESLRDATTTFEMKGNETRSYVKKLVGELQKLDPVSGEDQITVKSKSKAEIEKQKNIETMSHVRKVLQKLEPAPAAISISGEDQITIEMKKNNETTSHVRKVVQKLEPATSSIPGEDQKTVKSDSTAEIETKNSETASHTRKEIAKSNSGEDQKSVQNSYSRSNSWRLDSCSSFGSYGSMRKEKEWKRTLACKLFEERNSSGGEEGMDSLWEAYEEDNIKKSKTRVDRKEAANNQKKVMMKNKKKSELFKYFEDGEEEEDDDEDEFMSNGQLCCLKALKLSTGKMNLGMGKPNLVKISKVFKGFGWLHHVGSKHGKNK